MSDDNNLGTCCCLLIAGYLLITIANSLRQYFTQIFIVLVVIVVIYLIYSSKMKSKNNKSAPLTTAPFTTDMPPTSGDGQSGKQGFVINNDPANIPKTFVETSKSVDVNRANEEEKVENYYQLTVEVLDEKGEPIKDASVTIESDIGIRNQRTSNIDGKVIFPKLKHARYNIRVSRDGFSKEEKSIFLNSQQKVPIKLKEYSKLYIKILDKVLQHPVPNASVKVGNEIFTSEKNGELLVSNLLKGSTVIEIEKSMYFSKKIDLQIKEKENEITLYLDPNLTLENKYVEFRKELESALSLAFSRLPLSANTLLPEYYRMLLISLLDMIESMSLNPLYLQDSSAGEKFDELYASLKFVLTSVCSTLTEPNIINDLIDLGNIGVKNDVPELTIDYNRYSIYLNTYMKNPLEFIEKFRREIEWKLSSVDSKITYSFHEYIISPIEGIWAISKKMIQIKQTNATREAACLLVGSIILDAAEDMFTTEEIVSMLKKD